MVNLKKNKNEDRTKTYCCEILLNNMVSDEIQSMLRPLNLMQKIIFLPQYSIRDNFITPNNSISNSYTICVTISFIIITFYRIYLMYIMHTISKNSSYLRLFVFIFDLFFYALGFIIHAFVCISQTKINTDFVLTIQEVHNSLYNTKYDYKKFMYMNWVYVFLLFMFYISSSLYTFLIFKEVSIMQVVAFFFLICFDAYMVCAIRLMTLLKDELDRWNKEVLNSSSKDDDTCKMLFQCYANILECYDRYRHSYRIVVSQQLIKFVRNQLQLFKFHVSKWKQHEV